MPPQRFRQAKLDVRKASRQSFLHFGQIAPHMHAGGQEIRHHHHAPGPLFDAARAAGLDIRLGQLREKIVIPEAADGIPVALLFAQHAESEAQMPQYARERQDDLAPMPAALTKNPPRTAA